MLNRSNSRDGVCQQKNTERDALAFTKTKQGLGVVLYPNNKRLLDTSRDEFNKAIRPLEQQPMMMRLLVSYLILGWLMLLGMCNAYASNDCELADAQYDQAIGQDTQAQQLLLLRSVVQACPSHALSLNHMGVLLEAENKPDEAYDYYLQAIAADPDYPASYAGKADIEHQRGNFRAAVESYQAFMLVLDASIANGDPHQLAQYRAPYEAKHYAAKQKLGNESEAHYKTNLALNTTDSGVMNAGTITRVLLGIDQTKRNISLATQSTRPSIDIPIQFEYNSAQLGQDSFDQINEIAAALTSPALSEARIRIEGHTDSVGSIEFNQRLSQQRANTVAVVLVNRYGLNGQRFEVVGYGETQAVASNETQSGRARNRRVTFVNLQ